MAQRPQGGPPGGGSRKASRRVTSAPVKKPFPWGFVAGVTALVLVLGGVLVYAVLNTGSGFQTALDKTDKTFKGLRVTSNQSQNHVATRVDYPDMAKEAPDGGNHNPIPQTCAVYDQPVVPEHAVHSLEHGAVWVTYRPDLPADQVSALKTLVDGNPYRLMSPYPGQTAAVALQAWGRRLDVPSASDPKVAKFLDAYTNGPQTREKGAACSGVDQPGTVPFVQAANGSYVPGSATGVVPGQGSVPSGAAGSAAPGSAVAPDPAAVPTTAPVPAPTP